MSLPLLRFAVAVLCLFVAGGALAQDTWTEIPAAQWQGPVSVKHADLKARVAAAIALPTKDAATLKVSTAETVAAGLYEVRLSVSASHTGNAIAFSSSLQVLGAGAAAGDAPMAEFPGYRFARAHQAETSRCLVALPTAGPLALDLRAVADKDLAEKLWVAADLKKGGPKPGEDAMMMGDADGGGGGLMDLELETVLSPGSSVYYLVDKVEYRALSHSGQVTEVTVNKIRYTPGETLQGQATVVDLGGRGGKGTLNVYLEHKVQDRQRVQQVPVELRAGAQSVAFEVVLPTVELGYALVAEYVSADGKDRSEAAEYFNIAANFQRVAIFGGGLATRDAVLDEATIRRGLTKARRDYFNATEYFAWAEDDLVGMSPATDFWSSGQTNYRMHKETIQAQIRLAHEQGFAVSTYGKFQMSGLKGWETAFDYPNDHRGQYNYPVGAWEGVNVGLLDRRRDKDFTVYSKMPVVPGENPFRTWWSEFMPINPDASPQMVRLAAEECVRSIEMFGWDAIRWDGHPRGAGWVQCGRSGKYQAWAARQTQSLVRYFKDIVGAKYPDFGHGYNYLLIEPNKGYDWAVEDFELDELCRDGGLIMNESIGNASAGWTFAQIARNLQVEGDLCRERGGYYLGISFGSRNPPRDIVIESALWAAAGCRPYNEAMSREVRRYCTRYSQYTFDERLRRLATPEKVLQPTAETPLWWQPFVYQTPVEDGKCQLVINLLNLPLEDKRPPRDGDVKPTYDLPPGIGPVSFALTLPAGIQATAAQLINPETLEVTPLTLQDGRFTVPAVTTWQVAILDLTVADGATTLATLYGPPKTLGVPRPAADGDDRRDEVVLDPTVEIWEVNKRMDSLAPEWEVKSAAKQAALDALTGEARDVALLARRPTLDYLKKQWWKGAAIPADLELQKAPPSFGDLTPHRNGRLDVYYARGAMDYRLRMNEAFARFDRFQVHQAELQGAVRSGPGMRLGGGVPAKAYPDYDLLLFTGIPHAAIGVPNSYGLVDYVKAGGGAFFTGGEYAFGKGGYLYTVLDRDLLPVHCTEMVDTVYTDTPQSFEPGPDFAELGVTVDFAAKPAFWVRNEVVLKPGAKVFLSSGGRPILVGWQLGKGRVLCLLVDHRGMSADGVTAFFDWADWPALAAAAMRWAAPDAARQGPTTAAPKPVAKTDDLAASLDDLLEVATKGDDGMGGLPSVETPLPPAEQAAKRRADALTLLDIADAGRVAEGAAAVAEWNRLEATTTAKFAKLVGDDTALLETSPCLDAEAILTRLAWLAYLSRHDPQAWGAMFLREWLMAGKYAEYAGWTGAYLIDQQSLEGDRAAATKANWTDLLKAFQALREKAAPDAAAYLARSPATAGAVLAAARFTPAREAAMNLLGDADRAATTEALRAVAASPDPDLAGFAKARLAQ